MGLGKVKETGALEHKEDCATVVGCEPLSGTHKRGAEMAHFDA